MGAHVCLCFPHLKALCLSILVSYYRSFFFSLSHYDLYRKILPLQQLCCLQVHDYSRFLWERHSINVNTYMTNISPILLAGLQHRYSLISTVVTCIGGVLFLCCVCWTDMYHMVHVLVPLGTSFISSVYRYISIPIDTIFMVEISASHTLSLCHLDY